MNDVPARPIAISVQQLAALRQEEAPHLVLDVREDDELAICRVENAVHIPMAQIPARLQELPQDTPLVVMCHHGMRSLRVVHFLRDAGYENAINLAGGIDAWTRQIDPSLRLY